VYTGLKLLCLCLMHMDVLMKQADHTNKGS